MVVNARAQAASDRAAAYNKAMAQQQADLYQPGGMMAGIESVMPAQAAGSQRGASLTSQIPTVVTNGMGNVNRMLGIPDPVGGAIRGIFGQGNQSPIEDIRAAQALGRPITDAQWAQAGLPPGGGDQATVPGAPTSMLQRPPATAQLSNSSIPAPRWNDQNYQNMPELMALQQYMARRSASAPPSARLSLPQRVSNAKGMAVK